MPAVAQAVELMNRHKVLGHKQAAESHLARPRNNYCRSRSYMFSLCFFVRAGVVILAA